MMRAIIVDDEPPAREYLRLLLDRIGGVEIIGEAEDAAGCLEMVQSGRPDVVFLDIRLPGMSGVEAAQIIAGTESSPRVVFVTGYDEYAALAFDMEAADYITKPFSQDRIRKTIERLKKNDHAAHEERTGASTNSVLPIKHDEGWTLAKVTDILFVKTEGRKVRIQTRGKGFVSHYTIAELEERLCGSSFFRANEGCLVNLRHVREVVTYGSRSYELLLDDDETYLALSRSRAQELKRILGLH